MTEPKPKILIAQRPNRQQRRAAERAQTGKAGKKSTRPRPVQAAPTISPEEAQYLAEQKVIESAQNIKQATRGAFWLPGDKLPQ